MEEELIDFLGKLISFKSISADEEMAGESLKTAQFIESSLKELGAEIKIVYNEVSGKNPLIFGKIGNDPSKKTLVFYSHYDVQPAHIDDGWATEPFEMTRKEDGYLYARGTNDDKGPIAATYFAVKELLDQGELPVNVGFLYEGEEESSSGGFEETVLSNKDFFGKVDGIMILDTSWFTDKTPSMDYGFRGIVYLSVKITGPNADQHSGLVGGTIREPMTDLMHLMSKLIDLDGNIMIEGFHDSVRELTENERALYDNIEYDLDDYKNFLGLEKVISDDAKDVLMRGWRFPSLSIHGVQGAFHGPGSKTVVPGTVIGKVSVRIVPDQQPKEIEKLFIKFVEKKFSELNSSNKIEVESLGAGDWWIGDVDNFLYKAGKIAIEDYWGMTPAFTRSGGSIPIVPFMEKTFSAPAIGLGIGQSSDGAHSQNERLRLKNLIGGKEVIKKILQLI